MMMKFSKATVRKILLRKLRQLSEAEINSSSQLIAVQLHRLFTVIAQIVDPVLIGYYLAQATEVRLSSFVEQEQRLHPGFQWALPIVTALKQPLSFYPCTPSQVLPLRANQFFPKLLEYVVTDPTAVVQPQIMLVPLVGFDAYLYRLGRGGGFYDRSLASATRTANLSVATSLNMQDELVLQRFQRVLLQFIAQQRPFSIGIAYNFQATDLFAPEAHDCALDMLVTETEILWNY